MIGGCKQEGETQEARPVALVKFTALDLKTIVQKVQEQEKEAMIVIYKHK